MSQPSEAVPTAIPHPEITLPPVDLFIDGRWVEPAAAGRFPVLNPVTEAVIAEVGAAGADDVDRAVAAARRQVDGGELSRLSGAARARLLGRLADLLERDSDHIAALERLDVGQPSRGSASAVATLRYFAGWADKIDGRHVAVDGPQAVHAYTTRTPIGVVAAITPWNAPLMIAAWKLAPALAAGCAVVLKPPEDAPLSSLHLATLVEEVGFPAGAINVVPGTGADAGAPLARHRGVDKVSFTGSPETGRKIALAAAESFTPITLELGGKSPQLIFADAELERAIPASAASFYGNAGQICAAGTRVLVQSDVADEVSEGLSRAAQGVRVGDPFAPETTIGPLINAKQLQRVLGYIDQGRTEGADLITGGGRVGTTGYFVEPTLFRGSNDLVISQEEIFGPVATVIPFTDLDEAIAIANTTRYGLSAGIWTRDVSKAHLVASRLRAGSVNINGGGPPVPNLPWGGFKESGVGRELSFSGIEACTEEKSVRVYLT